MKAEAADFILQLGYAGTGEVLEHVLQHLMRVLRPQFLTRFMIFHQLLGNFVKETARFTLSGACLPPPVAA